MLTRDLLGVKPDWGIPLFTVFGAEQGKRSLFPSTMFDPYMGLVDANVHTNVHSLRMGEGLRPLARSRSAERFGVHHRGKLFGVDIGLWSNGRLERAALS